TINSAARNACSPVRICWAHIRNPKHPHRPAKGFSQEVRACGEFADWTDRLNRHPRRTYVGPKHDDANRRQEDEGQHDDRDPFHSSSAMGTVLPGARGHNLKAGVAWKPR